MNVVVGCGLGGTSLINAAIALRPDPRIFDDTHWPAAIRGDSALSKYFDRAEAMLRPTPYPDDYPPLPKLEALRQCAQALQLPFTRVPVMINFRAFEGGVNPAGAPQSPCVNCGDCVSGCNHGAKNTVLMNYLPDAARHGAEIYTQVQVRQLTRRDGRWSVLAQDLENGRSLALDAEVVVLAAGTLGSTEILLRSAQAGLPLSEALGKRFSANGDMIGFAYNTDRTVGGVGFGTHSPDREKPVGPCSTGLIDLRAGKPVPEGMIVVDGAIPGALGAFLPGLLAAAAATTGTDAEHDWQDRVTAAARSLESSLLGPRVGAIDRTLFFLVVAQDDAGGRMFLEDDRLRIRWPGAGEQAALKQASGWMQRGAEVLDGTYIPNPVWNALTNHNLVTGHPLGGCAMADGCAQGVVNHKGQVYDGAGDDTVHRGLYVMDGAVVPGALGVNPALTISALAERSCELLARDFGWTVRYDE
jgi:cholesterol oxidase